MTDNTEEVSDATNVIIDVLVDPKIYVGNIAFRNKHYIIGLDINVLTSGLYPSLPF